MDSLDTVRERFAASEQQTESWKPQTHALAVPTCPGERRRRWWPLVWPVAAVAILGLALALPHSVQAKTFHCDAGDVQCLIDAITAANANGEENTIRLQAGTYTLTTPDNSDNGLPVITSSLTITGRGAETTIIERDASTPGFRLFIVAESGTLSLERLTLRGGRVGHCGAGIANGGTLTVTRSTITDNIAESNAGICNIGGPVTITNSTLTFNVGVHDSGAVGNFGGTMVITATTVAHNGADGAGAILNEGGTLTVTNSAFTDNTTFFTGKGALVNSNPGDRSGTLVVSNTTFARNVVSPIIAPSVGPYGVAIANRGTLVLTNSTLADNVVSGELTSGSALVSASGATTILQNTLIARNVGQSVPGSSGTIGPDCLGVVTSFGTNLIGDTTACTITRPPGVRDLTGDPGLGEFTENGRPGDGHVPLLPTSQAIDAASDAVCPLRDQLGHRRVNIPRVGTSRCDIGAIEFPGKHDRHQDEKDAHHDDDLAACLDCR